MDKIHDRSFQPFIVIDQRVLDMPLSEKAFRVYAQLKKYANREGQCFPSQSRLGRECFPRMTQNSARVTAIKALQELEELGLLSKKNNSTDTGGTTSNTYVLLEPPPVTPRYTPL